MQSEPSEKQSSVDSAFAETQVTNDLSNYVLYGAATQQDLRPVIDFDAEYHPYPKSTKWWANRIVGGSPEVTVVHLAKYNRTQKILGYLVSQWKGGVSLYIHRLFVQPEYRRHKVGTRLVLDLMSEKPPLAVGLQYVVPEYDITTQKFLQTAGFRATIPMRHGYFADMNGMDGIKFVWSE
jgi:ribosomal protein S18 acetylase RimI-like enzyme